MPKYTYLIIGGGMTAAAAIRGIREVDKTGSIGVISAETDPPYNRPPLTKDLWKGESIDNIWRKVEYPELTLHLGRRATSLDPAAKQVVDDQGESYSYDRLLLATGGTPRRLPFGGDNIIYFRTLDDYRRLRESAESAQRFAVIGGGFIGSEIAAALAMNQKDVTLIFPGAGIGDRIFPADLSQSLNRYFEEKGVTVRTGMSVTNLDSSGDRLALEARAKDGSQPETIEADVVVAGIGIQPNSELAEQAGLEVENGIVVDSLLRTSDPDIFAAGDIASFNTPALEARMRIEHEDNANAMGRRAGQIMAGRERPYEHLSFFYSDLFDRGYEAVGTLDPRLETFSDWSEPFRTGVVYYLDGGRVKGVLLWNVWNQVSNARKLIAEPGPFTPGDLKGRLPAPK